MVAPVPTHVMLLRDPLFNKGTAFTEKERDKFKLHGLLPPHVGTLEEQIERRWEGLERFTNPLDKYVFLRELQDTNEVLFLALVCRYIQELMPIVYTPTVGEGCLKFSHLYRKPRGLSLSIPLMSRIPEILSSSMFDQVEIIVVTDGERILGLGDLGANGMGIPVGKLALYAAGGGFQPRACLPVLLDVGTDNQELLNDPLYIGWKHKRVRGSDYDRMIDAFVQAAKARWPSLLLQWEDFHKDNATRLLNQYRNKICSFNDDIQGTAAVATGAIIAASKKITDGKLSKLRYCILGAGSAGCGIADMLRSVMSKETEYDPNAYYFAMLNSKGLLTENSVGLQSFQMPYILPHDAYADWSDIEDPMHISLLEVVKNFKPSVLIGVSTIPGAFTEEIVRTMASYCEHPIIFPLSNPSKVTEAKPQDLMRWTNYTALVSTGSPFGLADANKRGTIKIPVAQANNVYIFPGMGLGVTAVGATRVTDEMLESAAITLAALSPLVLDGMGPLLPPMGELAEVSKKIAVEVAKTARDQGVCPAFTDDEIIAKIRAKFWEPKYPNYC
eukprot:Protomagalhaensia_wolfi_Nauph_80__6040@NODE_838_length_1957_cov_299_444734_g630_i0_p1_GENE_NODE_838_length_1957_cov_299_444734_g630_i0NODE_838_length_1957_cov_299_444734_g630_i0_p1_ORF_typecomplete_len558_score132_01Malic_M/PF03949_15/8_3e75malic/PF00390_19/6_8e74NDUF_B12/PF08122_12/0_43_NODE_838_length_1957_cov_299_444734_g630_i01421815